VRPRPRDVTYSGNSSTEDEIPMQTTGAALLEAMYETGIEYLFANLGSDHTALV